MKHTKYLEIDTQIAQQLKSGDEEAFTAIFRQYARLLFALAYRYLKSVEAAEDAVQFVFMRLWEKREVLDLSNGVRSLLYTMLKNYILNELRHQTVTYEKLYAMAQNRSDSTEKTEMERMEQREMELLLRKYIGELPLQKKIICRMKLDEGLSNQEIADRMNIEINTVKSHYTQAIKMLREKMKRMRLLLWAFW